MNNSSDSRAFDIRAIKGRYGRQRQGKWGMEGREQEGNKGKKEVGSECGGRERKMDKKVREQTEAE